VLSGSCTGEVLIKNAEATNKSYPGFFGDFAELGGICSYMDIEKTLAAIQ